MTKSRWFIKDQIFNLLQNRKKAEMSFSRNLSLDRPCLLNNFSPKKLLKLINQYSKLKSSIFMYSPVCLKTQFLFKNNKCIDNSWNNYIVYTPYNEEREKKRKDMEDQEKKDLEEIIRKGREKRRKERIEKMEKERKEKEEQEKKEKEEQEKKEKEEKEKAGEVVEGEEGGEKKEEEHPVLAEENQEEKKENEGEEKKEEEVKKEEENKPEGEGKVEGEGEGAQEKKEGEGEGEAKEEEKKEEKGEEKKEGEEEEKKEGEEEKLTTDRQKITDRESGILHTNSDKQNNALDDFKNLTIDKNYIQFHFLNNEEEVKQFLKCPDDFQNYLLKIKNDIIAPKILSFERIAEILYKDEEEDLDENLEESENQDSKEEDSEMALREKQDGNLKFGLNIKYEYQDCCPVDIVENKLQKIGKLAYSIKYNGKYYKFSSMENMLKFKKNPNKYINLDLKVRKVNQEQNNLSEKQIMFNNTVNFLEFTFGSLITKGMLELSNNRIKYPYLNVKESSLKYLALYLKANNPKNNKYAMEKYKKILKDFIRNSELPWELYKVYNDYKKEKDNALNKKLIRKQLDTVSVKYDKLMEKAKIQNNTRFANFFKISNETNEEEKNE